MRLPIIGDANDIPLVQGFDLVIAARHERYKGTGTLVQNFYYFSDTGLPPGTTDITDLCDREALGLERESASNSRLEPTVSGKWTLGPDLALRGSYATGYLPPRLNDLVPVPGLITVSTTDPERGGEFVGGNFIAGLPGITNGNPDLNPERSTTISFGAILTPRQIPGLRFSADYTRIRKRDNYFNPELFLLGFGSEAGQRAFETFLTLFPERFTRGPASDGFAVGPITFIDARSVNISKTNVESIDFALDYSRPLWGGTVDLNTVATHNLSLSSQLFPDGPVIDTVGARPVSSFGVPTVFGNTTLWWKGVGSLRWANNRMSIGGRARLFDSFDLDCEGTVDPENNARSIRSQTYVDLFGSYRIREGLTLQGGVNNVFSKRPPFIDTRTASMATSGSPISS